jgi:hypothetical protein
LVSRVALGAFTGEEACQVTLGKIFESYSQYLNVPQFKEGFEAHGQGNFRNPYHGDPHHDGDRGVKAKAWDRGIEAASRWQRERLRQAAADLDSLKAGTATE